MTFLFVFSLLASLLPDPQTPNFYPGLTSAREASKKEQKEMVIFFTEKSCASCEAAWSAFIKDPQATARYVSTRMDVRDFDGGIFFDLLDLNETPSWVVLHPNGTEKERWQGGWKDASGNPVLFDGSVKMEDTPKTTTPPATLAKREEKKEAPPATTATKSTSPNKGYVLQAGYFGSVDNARKLVADLESKGFNNFEIITESKDNKEFFRVISKVIATEASAAAEQQRLGTAGIKTSLKQM